jgi:hypothetical protein
MRSHLWTSALVGLVLISSSAAARAEETRGAATARLALGPAAALPLNASSPAGKTERDIRDLLADPAIRFAVGLAENAWDFSAPDGVPGFGPLLVADKRGTTTTPACAERDRDLITSIEDHGNANDVAPDRLANAALSMLQARGICGNGRETEALALYDRTLQGLAQTHASR